MVRTAQKFLVASLTIILIVAPLYLIQVQKASAATGIYEKINFQGKLVNVNGTNVANGNYTVIFTLYDAATVGTNLWDETQTVAVADGVFQVELGSVDTTIAAVDFNTDTLYLGVKVGADTEMTPRIRFTAVPYAFMAEKVNGLTVTNTTGTFTLTNAKTLTVQNTLTFSGTDSTAFVLPSTGGNLVTEAFTQTLTNKTIGSTGLTFSGATTDILTISGEDLRLDAIGSGDLILTQDHDTAVLIGSTSNTYAPLSVRGGYGSNAAFIVDQLNTGDILSASASGTTKFRIDSSGNVGIGVLGAGTIDALLDVQGADATAAILALDADRGDDAGDTWFLQSQVDNDFAVLNETTEYLKLTSTGVMTLGAAGYNTDANGVLYTTTGGVITKVAETETASLCLLSGSGASGVPSWASCPGGSGTNYWQLGTGTLAPGNLTVSTLFGATATTSAKLIIAGSIQGGKSALIVNQTEAEDILTASASGTTRFTVANDGSTTITSAGSSALTVGRLGATTPALQVDASAATAVTGLKLTAAAAGGGYTAAVVGGNTDEALSISPKGAGLLTLASGTTGNIQFFSGSNFITSAGALTLAGGINLASANLAFSSTGGITFTGGTISDATDGVDVADDLDVSGLLTIAGGDGSSFAGGITFNDDVLLTLAATEALTVNNTTQGASDLVSLNSTWAAANAADVLGITTTYNLSTNTGLQYGLNLTNADNTSNTGVIDALALFSNDQATETLADGIILRHNVGSGTLTDALQIENTTAGGTITNAINILETAGTITTGINIGTPTTAIAVGVVTTVLDSANLDISNAGAITGATGVSLVSGDVALTSGNVTFSSTGGITFTGGTISDATDGVDIADDLDVSGLLTIAGGDGSSFAGGITFNDDVLLTLGATEAFTVNNTTQGASDLVSLNSTWTGANAGDVLGITTTYNLSTNTGLQYGLNLTNADNTTNTGVIDALAVFSNDQATETLTDGIIVRHNAASGTLTDGIQIENTTAGGTITNAINIVETAGTITTGINVGANVGTAIAVGAVTTVLDSANLDISNAGVITGATGLTSSGTITFSSMITDANGVLYTTTGGVVTRVVETETANQCLISGAGVSGIPSWGSCSAGSNFWVDGGTFTYLDSTIADDLVLGGTTVAAGSLFFDESAAMLYLGNDDTDGVGADTGENGGLTFYSSGNVSDPTITVDASGNLTISAPQSGASVILGDASGNIQLSLSVAADVFLADKTVTLAATYGTLTDYTFTRALAGAFVKDGVVFKITDTSSGGTISPDMLVVNGATGTTGNLLVLEVAGADKLIVNSAGALTNSNGGDVLFSGDADTNFQYSFSAAPGVDMVSITNAGQGVVTTDIDGIQLDFVQADDADGTDTNYGLSINLTAASGDAGDILAAINLSVTGQTANNREIGINIGSGFDEDIHFASSSARIRFQSGGEIKFTDGSNNYDLPLARLKEYFASANYGVFEAGGFINIDGSFYSEQFNNSVGGLTASHAITAVTNKFGDNRGWGGLIGTSCTMGQNTSSVTNFTGVGGYLAISPASNSGACWVYMGAQAAATGDTTVAATSVPGMLNPVNKFIMYYKVKHDSATHSNRLLYIGADNYTGIFRGPPPAIIGDAATRGGMWFANHTMTGTATNQAAIGAWVGLAKKKTEASHQATISCGAGSNIVTNQYALMRIEARATNDLHFFLDADVSNGISLTECGSGITNTDAIPNFNMKPSIIVNNQTASGAFTLFVDLMAFVQDDPRDIPGSQGLAQSEAPMAVQPDPIAGADLAENYRVDGISEVGEIVVLGDEVGKAKISNRPNDRKLLGVISESPALVMGQGIEGSVPIALTGRVPVKVNNKGGKIRKGDPITSSNVAGVGMRATTPGKIIGTAMEDFSPSAGSGQAAQGKIMVNINVGYYIGDEQDTALISQPEAVALVPSAGEVLGTEATGSAGLNGVSTGSGQLAAATVEEEDPFEKGLALLGLKKFATESAELSVVNGLMSIGPATFVEMTVMEIMRIGTNFVIDGTSINVLGNDLNLQPLKQGGINFMDGLVKINAEGIIFAGTTIFDTDVEFKKLVAFTGETLFKGLIRFENTPVFNKDSAGYATVKKGSRFVDVIFEKELSADPVVNATLVINEVKEDNIGRYIEKGLCETTDTIKECQDKIADNVLGSGTKYAVVSTSRQGFMILLDQKAPIDMTFSWNAIIAQDATTYESTREEQKRVLGIKDVESTPAAKLNDENN